LTPTTAEKSALAAEAAEGSIPVPLIIEVTGCSSDWGCLLGGLATGVTVEDGLFEPAWDQVYHE
jgi:hypothetical protein